MRTATLAAAAAAVVMMLAHPSGAATGKVLRMPDPVGDANGINSQDIGLPLASRSTAPAQLAAGDIVRLDVATLFKGSGKARKAKGFTVTLRLAAPVQKGVNYLVLMTSSSPCGDSSTMQLGYDDLVIAEDELAVCHAATTSGNSSTIGVTELSADKKSIIWTIDAIFKPGTRVSSWYASSSVFVAGVYDELSSDAVFNYGR
ncbi:MAG: hypothetical protein ABR549_08375 [Mycobacteriales bacterium]